MTKHSSTLAFSAEYDSQLWGSVELRLRPKPISRLPGLDASGEQACEICYASIPNWICNLKSSHYSAPDGLGMRL
jgi:hypothetical protein